MKIMKYWTSQGPAHFRRNKDRAAAIGDDDPRRAEARKAILRELEDIALIHALDLERNKERYG